MFTLQIRKDESMESETFLAQGPGILGTPTAFSTAVKPLKSIPPHVEEGRSSFGSIAARLSLDKEVEEDKGEGCWSPTKMAAGTPKATPDNSAETIAATDSSASTSDTPTITSPMVSELAHVMVKEEEDRKRRDGNDGQWLRSLIEDEQEPTVMFEAEEFSLFEPTHLMTYMNSDSYLQRESDGGNETLSKGLASIYLKPSTPLSDEEEEEEEAREEEGNINPFDSDAEVQSLGDIDIGLQSKDEFLADLSKEGKLAQDENESCTEQLNFTHPTSCSHISDDSQKLSVTSFFERKSYPLGSLSTDHPPEMRPQFAGQLVLLSPPGVDIEEEKPLTSGPQPSSILSPVIRDSFVPADLAIPALQLTTVERSGVSLSATPQTIVSSDTTLTPSLHSNLPSMYLRPNDTTLHFNSVLVSPLPSQIFRDSQTSAPTPTLARVTNLWTSEDDVSVFSDQDQPVPARVDSTPPPVIPTAGTYTTPLVTVSSVLEASPHSVPTTKNHQTLLPASFSSSSYHTPMSVSFTSPAASTHYRSPIPVSPSFLGKVEEEHTMETGSATPSTCTSTSSESTYSILDGSDSAAAAARLVEVSANLDANRQDSDTILASLKPTATASPERNTSSQPNTAAYTPSLTSQPPSPPPANRDSFISEQSSNSFNSASGYLAGVSTFSHSTISTHDRRDQSAQPSATVSLPQHSPTVQTLALTQPPSSYSSLLSSNYTPPSFNVATTAAAHLPMLISYKPPSALTSQTTTTITHHSIPSLANKHSPTPPPHIPPMEQVHLSTPSISSHDKDGSDGSKEGTGDDLDTTSSSVSSSLSAVDRKCLPSVSALLTVPTSQISGRSDVTIEAPQSVMLGEVCCVGTSEMCHLAVRNKHTSRWTQCNVVVQQVLRDGHVDPDDSILTHHSTCFIGPCMTEKIKLTFSPRVSGSYEITLLLSPCLVTDPTGGGSAAVSVVIKALAEEPRVQVLTGFEGGNILNYGTVLAGKAVLLPLYLVNHSAAAVPIRLSLATTSPAWFCYSFPDPPERLLSTTPSKRQVNSTTIKLCLPPKTLQMEDPEIHTIMVQFSAPQKTLDDAMSVGPAMQHNARLDVFLDGIHSNQSISRIELSALVGVVRLHAYRDTQFISLSSEIGHTASQVVPLKNAGNIDIVVQFEVNVDGFSARPDRLHLQPTERAEVVIEFSPSAASSEIVDGSMLLHITPEGPMYTIKLRGTAVKPAHNLVTSSNSVPVVSHSPQLYSPPPPPYCSAGTRANNCVLNVQSILFRDTAVGNRSEKLLRVHNPYNAVLTWQMVPVSPSFLKTMDNTTGELYKTSQVVFTTQGSGRLQPAETKEVRIAFQPYYAGYNYTQMWDLQVVGDGIEKKSYRISLGGKGLHSSHHMEPFSLPSTHSTAPLLPAAVHGGLTSLGVSPIYTQTQLRSPHLHQRLVPPVASSTESRRMNLPPPAAAVRHVDTDSHYKQTVYLSNDEVNFPTTCVGDRSSLKIRVCNKESATLTFEVLKPNPPFSIAHDKFTLRSKQYARLPVHFCPTHPNQLYKEILAIKTASGHQMFAILKGQST